MRNLKWSHSPSDCGLGLRLGKKRPVDIPRWYKYHQLAETLPGRVDKEQHWHCQPRLSSRVTHHISEIGGRKISDSLDYFLSVPVSRFSTLCPDEKRQIQLDNGNALQWWEMSWYPDDIPTSEAALPCVSLGPDTFVTILSSPSCHNSTHSETETIFHKTHQASCCFKNLNKRQKLCMSNNMRSSFQI